MNGEHDIVPNENENTSPEQSLQQLQNESENMEVHKHPHHVTHKKKWIEYLLEFFMLFLAVFLGFIAENIRENAIEHERAKEYANLLIEDLSADTAQLSTAAHVMNLIIMAGDSLGNLLSKNAKLTRGGKLYFYESPPARRKENFQRIFS
ncbi:MAG: hypothetical protein WDM78_03045 [Puia sp.]